MTQVFSYRRFSAKHQQHGDSIRRQTDLAVDYCTKNNLTLSELNFEDCGLSAFTGSHRAADTGLSQFIQACESGTIPRNSMLLVESLDRISREQVSVALQHFLYLVNDLGITVVTLMDNKVYTTKPDLTDLVVSLAIMERSNNESVTKSKRLSEIHAKKRANPLTSVKSKTCPWWLRVSPTDNTKFEVIEEKAEIVRLMFQLSIDGVGINRIIQHLESKDIKPPRTEKWGISTVGSILKSKRVLGEYQPHHYVDGKRVPIGEPVQNYYIPIVSENDYHLAQSRRTQRTLRTVGGELVNTAGGRTGDSFPNLFTKIARCSECGEAMHFTDKTRWQYLTCRNRIKQLCTNKPIPYKHMDSFLIEVYLSPQYLAQWSEYAAASTKQVTAGDSLEILESRLQSAQQSLESLMTATANFTNSVILKQMQTRSESIANLEQEIEEKKQQQSESGTDVYFDFETNKQLVANALQQTLFPLMQSFKTEPEKLTKDEVYRERVKLNRQLSKTFPDFQMLYNTDGLFITTNDSIYEFKDKQWIEVETPS
ncbi:recombinase family protein [Thalassotalea sp. HSM 43]|uniref:recombinase family protein n=1 Tax=Thalassotalea sp. HSM 43 TaxID=2552945 RepID=UPI0010809124|nr:recombinase family protein [Thalassotalea sp. HSM 43]QBY04692.1 recombinase family protein [Thalassotalea sp. HSM 43]